MDSNSTKDEEFRFAALNAAGHWAVQQTKLERIVSAEQVVETAKMFEKFLKGEG